MSHPGPGRITSRARSPTVARYCPLWAYHSLTVFVFGNSRATSQWVTHHGITLAPFSLNFGVPTEPEASELPKGLVLGRDENIHIRITPLGDVGCHKTSLISEFQFTLKPVSSEKALCYMEVDM